MTFEIGDIVKIIKGHHLEEFFPGKCVIDDKSIILKKTRYHIKSLDKKHMTWVCESELDMISYIREEKLRKIGIK